MRARSRAACGGPHLLVVAIERSRVGAYLLPPPQSERADRRRSVPCVGRVVPRMGLVAGRGVPSKRRVWLAGPAQHLREKGAAAADPAGLPRSVFFLGLPSPSYSEAAWHTEPPPSLTDSRALRSELSLVAAAACRNACAFSDAATPPTLLGELAEHD